MPILLLGREKDEKRMWFVGSIIRSQYNQLVQTLLVMVHEQGI